MEHADRCREHRKAIDEIGRAVDWIHGPHAVLAAARTLLHLLADDVVRGKLFCETGANELLDMTIDLRHRIAHAEFPRVTGLVAHGENAPEGSDDFGPCQRRKLDGHVLYVVQIMDLFENF